MPGSSTKIIAPTDGLAFDPGAGERSRAEAVARSRLDAVIAGEIGKVWALVDVPKVRGVGRETDVDKARRDIVDRPGASLRLPCTPPLWTLASTLPARQPIRT